MSICSLCWIPSLFGPSRHCGAGGSCGFWQWPLWDLVKSQRCGKELHVSHAATAQPMPEKSSWGSHYTATVPGKRVGHWGPLAVLQSLMPSICLNGFRNPSPQFYSSPRQTVFRLLSLPVINPFISKRSDQCCLEWELPCRGNSTGKTCRPCFGQMWFVTRLKLNYR